MSCFGKRRVQPSDPLEIRNEAFVGFMAALKGTKCSRADVKLEVWSTVVGEWGWFLQTIASTKIQNTGLIKYCIDCMLNGEAPQDVVDSVYPTDDWCLSWRNDDQRHAYCRNLFDIHMAKMDYQVLKMKSKTKGNGSKCNKLIK